MPPPRRPTANAAQRLTNIETALSELGGIVANLPSEGEARRLQRMQRDVKRILWILLVPFVASAAFLVFGAYQWHQAKQAVEQNRQGVSCMLGQLFEHRVTNQDVHDRIATGMGVDPTPATPLPPRYDANTLTELCRPFFPGGHE